MYAICYIFQILDNVCAAYIWVPSYVAPEHISVPATVVHRHRSSNHRGTAGTIARYVRGISGPLRTIDDRGECEQTPRYRNSDRAPIMERDRKICTNRRYFR